MEDVRDIVATNIRLARLNLKISQEELAALAGIDRTYISGIERGLRNPTITVLAQISEALGTSPAKLLSKQLAGDD
ncbi:MAG: XRE family transcriptional regulator [Microcystis wesenbergii Mw_MB_S_20031200_S109]|nr:MAG: XRE family transcriptional regulator [Microcystis wesenbergii Mw_MB_S_20031200_S109]